MGYIIVNVNPYGVAARKGLGLKVDWHPLVLPKGEG